MEFELLFNEEDSNAEDDEDEETNENNNNAVSYTHLTLPTNREV